VIPVGRAVTDEYDHSLNLHIYWSVFNRNRVYHMAQLVCKTSIHGFNSRPVLQYLSRIQQIQDRQWGRNCSLRSVVGLWRVSNNIASGPITFILSD
jgi:hypothetical protein